MWWTFGQQLVQIFICTKVSSVRNGKIRNENTIWMRRDLMRKCVIVCKSISTNDIIIPFSVGIKRWHNFLNQLNQKITKRLFRKRNLVANNDFFIIIKKLRFLLLLCLHSKEVILYNYCPMGLSWNKILFCNYASLEQGPMGLIRGGGSLGSEDLFEDLRYCTHFLFASLF